MSVTTSRTRSAAVVAALVLVAVASACSPAPGSSTFQGGTYDLDLSLPPQHAEQSFPIPGVGTCTITVDVPQISLPGATLTVGDAEFDQTAGTATIPNASVTVPHATVPIGTVALECAGHAVGSISVAVELEATGSVRTVVFDAVNRTLTLTQPQLSIPSARILVTGTGLELAPLELPPIQITVPTVSLQV